MYQVVVVFFTEYHYFPTAAGLFLPLSAAGRAGGSCVDHGESVGPGRTPRRVLWAFEVAKSGQ